MKLHNEYYLLRHGEAMSNIMNIISSWPETLENPLTDKGREQVKEAAKILKDKHVDLIFSSDILRARQTAEIVGGALRLKPKFDRRLREIDAGSFNGKTLKEWDDYFKAEKRSIPNSVPGGETYADVLKRVWDFLQDVYKKYHDKVILIVSHQCPLWILENHVKGFSLEEGLKRNPEEKRIHRGELKALNKFLI